MNYKDNKQDIVLLKALAGVIHFRAAPPLGSFANFTAQVALCSCGCRDRHRDESHTSLCSIQCKKVDLKARILSGYSERGVTAVFAMPSNALEVGIVYW